MNTADIISALSLLVAVIAFVESRRTSAKVRIDTERRHRETLLPALGVFVRNHGKGTATGVRMAVDPPVIPPDAVLGSLGEGLSAPPQFFRVNWSMGMPVDRGGIPDNICVRYSGDGNANPPTWVFGSEERPKPVNLPT